MDILNELRHIDERKLLEWLDQYRAYGPLPGILLTFMKSFVPPLPTILIVGVNAAVYGLWLGFLYSWIGIVLGCLVTFAVIRKIADRPYWQRWADRPRVRKGMRWVRRNAFSYVFLLSLFPVGPFVVINIAAALARMRFRSFLVAIILGKAVMVFVISFIGHDPAQFLRHPEQALYALLFVAATWWIGRWVETYGIRRTERREGGAVEEERLA
ncbi:TVP38/TMEM64 family protein [Cohnella sp. GCM10012308]|uniref:TVP38/TMEM64 family protein n=1 Tax=Cohnella sp. GCM10012308 TaxID=3317329 RepID=UPI003613F27B